MGATFSNYQFGPLLRLEGSVVISTWLPLMMTPEGSVTAYGDGVQTDLPLNSASVFQPGQWTLASIRVLVLSVLLRHVSHRNLKVRMVSC